MNKKFPAGLGGYGMKSAVLKYIEIEAEKRAKKARKTDKDAHKYQFSEKLFKEWEKGKFKIDFTPYFQFLKTGNAPKEIPFIEAFFLLKIFYKSFKEMNIENLREAANEYHSFFAWANTDFAGMISELQKDLDRVTGDTYKIVEEKGKFYIRYQVHPPATNIVEFKTGRFIFADSLHDIAKVQNSNFGEGPKWTINNIKLGLENGMIQGYVGNTCPTIGYSEEDQTMQIGFSKYEYENENGDYVRNMGTYKEIGHVVTDLWWYSIITEENLNKVGWEICDEDFVIEMNLDPRYSYIKKKGENAAISMQVGQIPAGKYRWKHFSGVSSDTDNRPFATFKKI